MLLVLQGQYHFELALRPVNRVAEQVYGAMGQVKFRGSLPHSSSNALEAMLGPEGEPKFYKFVKHDQPATGFWPINSITIWHLTLMGKIAIWTHKG